MKYSDIMKRYKLKHKQERDLLPVRKKKHDFVVIRMDWLLALGDLNGFRQTSRVLLALLPRLSSKEYKKIYLNEIRDEIGARRMEVERAMKFLREKKIILNESAENEGERRPKYFKFNPDFAEIDSDDLGDMLEELDVAEELNTDEDLDDSEV